MIKVYKFHADWCSHCKVITNKLKSNSIGIDIIDINVDDDSSEELTDKYKVYNLPTIVIVDEHDNMLSKYSGNIDLGEIKDKIAELTK